ncbi:uncharacterized protein N7496_000304 [Penicillium cataractarum]|uniref:Uncharacterized protein n=1 Tax=Penicillium cataractarum TaxID=2100454 RepID=A0A9W9VTT8_9EURO|nr:uncharacterized protein N7496_000304 [Penicillium cataractarum]KAJ5389236.1 hypothetical protein N7496_000304 [Penicillium cataractarum]
MVDTNSMKSAFMGMARSACEITETLIEAYAPYKEMNRSVAATYGILQSCLPQFRIFKTGRLFEGFVLPNPDENSLTRVEILAAMARVKVGINGFQQNERALRLPNGELRERLLCSRGVLDKISENLLDLAKGFNTALKAIARHKASPETPRSEERAEFFDIVAPTVRQGYSNPISEHHDLGIKKPEVTYSRPIQGDTSIQQGSDEVDPIPDFQIDIPTIISKIKWETQNKQHQRIVSLLSSLRTPEMEENLTTKPIENASEGDEKCAPRDFKTPFQSTTETVLSQNKDPNTPLYSCKICHSVGRWSDEDFMQRLHDSHKQTWLCPYGRCHVVHSSFDEMEKHVLVTHHDLLSREVLSQYVAESCPICQKPVANREGFEACACRLSSGWTAEKPADQNPVESKHRGASEGEKHQNSRARKNDNEVARSSSYSNEEMTETDDFESDISTAPSIFSLATLPSTTMTTDTRLTMDEMQTAIEELVGIFFYDRRMSSLYVQAIVEKKISPDRFVRNFRRLIKGFAMNLKDEAREAIEFDLAKLIATRACLIADKIGSKLELGYMDEWPYTPAARNVGRDLTAYIKAKPSIPEEILESSSDEDEEHLETFLALVSHGRSFILESAAFDNLRKELEEFVNPNRSAEFWFDIKFRALAFGLRFSPSFLRGLPLRASDLEFQIKFGPSAAIEGSIVFRSLWGLRVIDIAATRAKLQARGMEKYPLLNTIQRFCRGEGDIPEKHKRFRWTNRHGKRLYDDYVEHEPGALQALQEYLGATTVPKSRAGDRSQGQSQTSSAAARYTPNSSGLHARSCTSTASSGDITDQTIADPDSEPAIASQGMGTGSQSSRPLLLLSCIDRRGRPMKLHQEYVTHITDDRQLFHALRNIYFSHQRKLESFWSFRTLHSIHFMKFLYAGTNYIDIRCHHEICIPGQPCACIPPPSLVPPHGSTYQCRPIPSKHSPPVGPRLMMDFFADPDSRAPGSDLVMQQLPKKLDTERTSDGLEVTEAWGIFYREEWNWKRIWGVLVFGFFPPSLLFGVLWGILRKDVQGAFGVASWWMAGATILLGSFATAV